MINNEKNDTKLWSWAHLTFFLTLRQWILDTLPAIGTSTTLRFIKEKLLAKDMSAFEAAQALVASIHMVTADQEAITIMEVGNGFKISGLLDGSCHKLST